MKGKITIFLLVCAGIMALMMALPGPLPADELEVIRPRDIQREIDRLLVLYTEEHPDVQRLRARLERIKKLQAEQRASQKAAEAGEKDKMQDKKLTN